MQNQNTTANHDMDRKYAPLTITAGDGRVYYVSRRLVCSQSNTLASQIQEDEHGGNIRLGRSGEPVDCMLQYLHEGKYDLASGIATQHVEEPANSAGQDAGNSTLSNSPTANFLARHFNVHWVAYWCGLPELEALSAGKFKENLRDVSWPTHNISAILEHVYEDTTEDSAEHELQKAVEEKSMLHLQDLLDWEDEYDFHPKFLCNLIARVAAEWKKAENQRDEKQELLQFAQTSLQEAQDENSRLRLEAQGQQEKGRAALQIAEIDLTTARNETVQVRQEAERRREDIQKILELALKDVQESQNKICTLRRDVQRLRNSPSGAHFWYCAAIALLVCLFLANYFGYL